MLNDMLKLTLDTAFPQKKGAQPSNDQQQANK
jgi:hypothetical protein